MIEDILKKLHIKTNPNKIISILFYILALAFLISRTAVTMNMLLGNPEITSFADPMLYTLAVILAALGFCFYVNSGMPKTPTHKGVGLLFTAILIAGIVGNMAIEWINQFGWWGLRLLPNYDLVFSTYPEFFSQAFKSVSLVVLFAGVVNVADFIVVFLRDDDNIKASKEFPGLSVVKGVKENGPFTCEVMICRDKDTGVPIIVPEKKRFEATLVQGATGTGKTATVLLPMSAMDLEKKFFFREFSKKTAYGLLKRGVAYMQGPFSNEYINRNFSLDYVKPKKGHEDEFEKALSNVILAKDAETGEFIYKNLGITVVENDGKYIDDFTRVATNFDIDVLSVDPADAEGTLSINPFAIPNPAKVASIIADVLKSMYESEGGGGASDPFFTQVTLDAFQNLAILLKEMYPVMNNGVLPTLEDMLELLYNFDKVEEMSEEMKKIGELEQKYKLLISYFERNFYKPALNINGFEIPGSRGSGRKDTERFLYGAITQLNNLLRNPGLKKALCSRDNNIDFDKAFREGSIITACSRKGELGIIQSKAFGMFFILQFQDAVLRRSGSEDTRIPNFLYIDEFPEYLNKETDVMFTLFRKYRCGVTIAIQNLSQLEKKKDLAYYRQTVLANTKTQIIFGDTVPEDSKYWSEAFGKIKKVDPSTSYTFDGHEMVSGSHTAKTTDKERIKPHKLSEMGFRGVMFKTKDASGKSVFGEGKTDFLAARYKVKQRSETFNFEKYMIAKPTVSTYDIMDDDDDEFFGNNSSSESATSERNLAEHINSYVEDISLTKPNIELPDDFDIVIDDGDARKLKGASQEGAVYEIDEKPVIDKKGNKK